MKERTPLIVVLIIGIAIAINLNKDGRLFVASVNTARNTDNKSQTINPYQTGEVKGVETNDFKLTSPHKRDVKIEEVTDAGRFAGIEYVTIQSWAEEPLNVTGWKITSYVTGNSITIGTASALPGILPEQALILNPRDKMLVLSGSSSVGYSFRLNQCTGYLEDRHNFIPKLPLQCPAPDHEDFLPKKVEDNEECMDYIDDLDVCELPNKTLPNLSPSCKTYVKEVISYEGCLVHHSGDKKFLKPEWRVFANSKFPLWVKEGDMLMLWDGEGRLVDVYEYDD